MKSTIIYAIPFICAALAAPARRSEYDVFITLINDFTGGSAGHGIPSGNYKGPVGTIWGQDANLLVDGTVHASSALLNDVTLNGNRVDCAFNIGGVSYILNSEKTWVDLDGVSGPGQVNLNEATVSCVVAGEKISSKERRSLYDIEVTLFDDRTGITETRTIASGNYPNSVQKTFNDSKILGPSGQYMVTSAQLATVSVPGNKRIDCKITGAQLPNNPVITFDNLRTWVDLDGIPGAEAVDITHAYIACLVEGEL